MAAGAGVGGVFGIADPPDKPGRHVYGCEACGHGGKGSRKGCGVIEHRAGIRQAFELRDQVALRGVAGLLGCIGCVLPGQVFGAEHRGSSRHDGGGLVDVGQAIKGG